MKNFVLCLIATVVFTNLSLGQTSSSAWTNMMNNFKNSVDNEIAKECPKDMELAKFKTSLINGENTLSEDAQNKIASYTEPLKAYGLEFAQKNKLEAISDSDLIFYSSFSPDLPITDGMYNASQSRVTWADVGNCALAAIGANALYSLAFSGASSWSIAALTTTFTGVAKRFLGPIGVAIAVATFGLCIADAYAN